MGWAALPVLAAFVCGATAVCAQPAKIEAEGNRPDTSAGDLAPVAIPSLTPILIRFETEISSQVNKTGERFLISLAEPIIIGGKEIVPAGAKGEGEVIHAKKSGGSGAAGELVLAARWLDVDGRHLRLRSLKAATAGKDAIHRVDAFNAASVMAPLPIGLFGYAINGAKAVYAKGSFATAKTAEAFTVGEVRNSTIPPMPGGLENQGGIPHEN